VLTDEAIRILHQYDSPDDLLTALYSRQNIADDLAQWDIQVRIAQEGLHLARSIGDLSWQAYFLLCVGWSNRSARVWDSALQNAEGALSIFNDLGDLWGTLSAYRFLGSINSEQGDYETASHWFQRAEHLSEPFGNIHNIVQLQHYQAVVAIRAQKYAVAPTRIIMALKLSWNAGYQSVAHGLLYSFARAQSGLNELERAAAILSTIYQQQVLSANTRQRAQAFRDELQALLEPERFAAAWARGEARELRVLVAELLAEFDDT
jgi:tetratricopeptide (TPR) repeat protein